MKVLHVDRSQFFQKVVKSTTKIESVEFLSTDSVNESMALLKKNAIDLIITGQQLKDGTAQEFLEKLNQSEFNSIPVIIITSTDDFKTREMFFNLGVIDFISKTGFSPDRLNEHLNHFKRQDSMIEDLKTTPIAILDDSKLSRNVISSILKIYGITNVGIYSDPEDFLRSEKQYVIYLIDLMLPKISGEQIIVELRKKDPHAVIIAISSLDKFNTLVHVLESGADDYIIKPFDARFLMARLKSNFRHYQLLNEMEIMSITDSLTGAFNHRYLCQRLDELIATKDPQKYPFSILLLDIDHFKNINDTYGHPVGDEVLKFLSRHFMTECSKNDLFGRYGGEEFMLIMSNTILENAIVPAERMRRYFSETSITTIDKNLKIPFSGGLVQWDGETRKGLLTKVDKLLYSAKNDGRDKIKYK
ncbi:MAG: diguanylate cyclase [Spirochaetaceae bacterium]|jgi:two-component system cell cycle response regulator|nr:diguanylate cyclase [Spirochaetaceae bacterium]